MTCLLLVCALGAGLFDSDFATPPAGLQLVSRGAGQAAVAGGVLALDLTSPTAGKLAGATLTPAVKLPFRVVWEQRLATDSPHAYWGGLAVEGSGRGPVTVRLGGAAVGHRIEFADLAGVVVSPGDWVRLELTVDLQTQRLRVLAREGGAELGQGTRPSPAPRPPYRLTFFVNATPAEAPDGDAYAQDRGRHEFDNLLVEQLARPPARAGEAYDAREPIVFNTALRWRSTPAGPIAYDEQDLALTGRSAVSTWVHGGAVREEREGEVSRFVRPHANALGPDRVVLRQLQFHLGQHPRLRYRLSPTNARTRLRVTFTCPYHRHAIVLAETAWSSAELAGVIDLPAALRAWHDERLYAELDFVLDIDAPEGVTGGDGSVAAALALPREDAVVAPTHIVRTGRDGEVPITALVLAGGRRPDKVLAVHGDGRVGMAWRNNAWTADLALEPGVWPVDVVAQYGRRELRQRLEVRVTDEHFVTARRGDATWSLDDGARLPPLLGDLFGWVPWDDPTKPERKMVRGPESWTKATPPPLTKWRSLTGRELEERIGYLADNGARLLRLTPNTSPVESYLDAGGHVAPHGLEQLQRLLTVLDRHGVRALINLFHYEYGSASCGNFPPVTVYGDAGYDGPADFLKPFAVRLERGYLDDLLSAVGGDPVVLGYTLFGENDQIPGEAWVNGTAAFVKQHAKGLLVFEQGGGLQNHGELKPSDWDRFVPATDGGLGYRNYDSAGTPTDAYANVNARWYAQHAPSYLAEESSDGPGWYRDRITWLTPDFVTQFRDNLWASLCAPQAASLFWSVILIDGERRLPTQVAERMDWREFRRAPGQLAVVCAAGSVQVLPALAAIDDACCRAGVTYDIVPPGTDVAGYAGAVDAAAWSALPAALLDKALLKPSEGNAATILADAAGKQLLAYVRNAVEHRLGPGYGEGVKELHRQRSAPREVTLDVRALPDAAELTVWDVDTGEVVKQGRLGANRRLALGSTSHDFAVLVRMRP